MQLAEDPSAPPAWMRRRESAHTEPAWSRRPHRITLDQLRIFSAVAEREHLTAAAQALRLSQGSVSVQVRRLERALGLPLLHRVGRNVRLTDVGRAVHRQAIEALRSAQTVEDVATAFLEEDRGQVTVMAGHVIGAHRLSAWLGPFVSAHPRIEVNIAIAPVAAAVEALGAGDADVVIVGSDIDAVGVEAVALERTDLVVVVSAQHPLARHPRPLQDLGRHRHLVHERGSATELRAREVLSRYAHPAQETALDEGALMAALRSGLGFAVMPRAIIDAEVSAGTLVVLSGSGRPVYVTFTAVRRKGPHTPVVEAFWAHLRRLGE